MSFLNPVILFGLFAASLPILIHLFTRTKSRTIPFSTLTFLKELQNQQIRKIKLRQILLLLLRTLIIIFIILAFARPSLKGSLSGIAAPNAKTSMAIILDNSTSMARDNQGATLFESAKQQELGLVDLLNPGDDVFLITTTDTAQDLSHRAFLDPDILRDEIESLRLNYQTTDISAALQLASRMLETSSNINKEIYLLSDVQQSGFADSLQTTPETVRLFVLPFSTESSRNLSVTSARLTSTILQRGKVAEALVTVKNTGDRPVSNALAQLFVDGKRVAQTSLQLEPQASKTEAFKFSLEQSGYSTAYVELEDDDLLQDNRRDFTFFVPEQLNVGLAGLRPRDTFYVNLVLQPEGQESFYNVRNIPLTNLSTANLDSLDVLFLSNVPNFSPSFVQKLQRFVENGGGLVLALGESVDLRSYNSELGLLGLPTFIDRIGSLQGEQQFTLGTTDLQHPLFSGVFLQPESEFTKPTFNFAIKVQETPDMIPVMSYSNGDPFLFEQRLGQGSILVVTTGFDVQLSDITHRTIFAPLVTRLVGYAGAAGSRAPYVYAIGEELAFKLAPQDVQKALEMKRPDDKFDRLKPEMTPNGAWIYYSQTENPGVYELLADGNVLSQWAVQPDAQESELAPIHLDRLQQRYRATVLSTDVNLNEYIYGQRHGTELWKYAIFIALGLLFVEMLLYREKGEVPAEEQRT